MTQYAAFGRALDYIDNPPFEEEVAEPPQNDDWTTVLKPGDVILARSAGGIVSLLIQKTDGFFTHAAIYLGTDENGVGWVAHAYVTGVQLWTLDRLRKNYNGPDEALGWARPDCGEDENLEAAVWAKQFAKVPTDDMLLPYDYRDLGLSFAIAVRAVWRRLHQSSNEVSAAEIESLLEEADKALQGRDRTELEPSTCSAFVWKAYQEGAGQKIVPNLVDGVRVGGGRVKLMLESDIVGAQARASGLRDKWTVAMLMVRALPGAAALLKPEAGGLLSEVVTPGDLWCSPTMIQRGRLF